MSDIFKQLAAPFPGNAVHWRAQTLNREGTSAMALAYIDARDVMNRLDSVVGPADWQDSYTETAKGRLICTLSVRINGEWIAKSDGAGDTDVEGEKGALSDALKRAAVKWGIGRYLYDMPVIWAECESYERNGKKAWKKWTDAGLRKLTGARGPAPVQSKPEQVDDCDWAALAQMIQATGTNVQSFCEHYKVSATNELSKSQFADAMDLLTKRAAAQNKKAA